VCICEGEVNNHARRGGANPAGQQRRVLGSYMNPNPEIVVAAFKGQPSMLITSN